MKLNNDLVIFDLETTDCNENYIIEIGAVYLNRENEIIGSYDGLITPPVPISQFVIDLTTLTNEQLTNEGLFPAEGLEEFESWVAKYSGSNLKKPRLCAWGTYFDSRVLRAEYKRQNRDYAFSGTMIDIKSLAFLWAALSGHRTDSFTVEKMAEEYMKMPPLEGAHYHRANYDALRTAQIYQRIVKDLTSGMFLDDGKLAKIVFE